MGQRIYDLAVVDDRGTYYQVLGLTANTFDLLADSGEKYIKLSSMAKELIEQKINEGHTVRLPKAMQSTEVLPGEVEVIESSVDEVGAAKQAAIFKSRTLVNSELAKISTFKLYQYNILHDELAAEGYFITNKNREEKYIEIIETGDADLIASLEAYLEARDEIDAAKSAYDRIITHEQDINNKTTVDEIVAASDQFIADFFATE